MPASDITLPGCERSGAAVPPVAFVPDGSVDLSPSLVDAGPMTGRMPVDTSGSVGGMPWGSASALVVGAWGVVWAVAVWRHDGRRGLL